MPSYLPLLLNPLLNALFNNPQPQKSPLQGVYVKLAKARDQQTVILVPPLAVLLHGKDAETGVPYRDLCYSEEFLSDHIITTNETSNAKLYFTQNNKEILIKKDVLFTGKGFKKSFRLKVLRYETFQSFNDYLPKGMVFLIMRIESPLFGMATNPGFMDPPPILRTVRPNQVTTTLEETSQNGGVGDKNEQEEVKFEEIIRNFPLIASSVGPQYQDLFKNFSVRDVHDTKTLKNLFHQSINLSSHIFQTLSDDLVGAIYKASPSIDLNSSVYHYVELNLYDKIWNKLCDLTSDFMADQYKDLEHLSISQISLPDKIKHNLSKVSILEKAIDKATEEFKKLSLSNNYRSKIQIVTDTIQALSNINALVIDADTLVGLLLLVVVRSNVPFLEAHLLYITSFSYEDLGLGLTGYSLSTFEAVLYYLRDEENLDALKRYSITNRKVFQYINSKDLLPLKKFLDNEQHNHHKSDSSIKARTSKGESLLMLAIQSNYYDTWKLLVDYEHFFPMEDILSDMTIDDSNLLNVALNSENIEIIDDLTDILLTSCTLDELKRFLNHKDILHSRTIGHYLFHYKDLIPKLGKFINWRIKDVNGQTPLFAICRSYDTPNYSNLIETVFQVVDNWYRSNNSEFDYSDHIDHRGNTLLHILQSNIEHLLKFQNLNINESNSKSYTPLMIYVKYNRLDNIQKILNVTAIDISKNDRNNFTCLDHSRNARVSQIIENSFLSKSIQSIHGRSIAVIRVKLVHNVWNLIIRGKIGDQEYEIMRSFTEFKQFLELLKLDINRSTSFVPVDYILERFSNVMLNIPGFSKLVLNNIINELNVFFQILLLSSDMNTDNGLLFSFLKNSDFRYTELTQQLKLKALDYKDRILKIEHGERLTGVVNNNHFFLQPEEINELNFFLKFSLRELSRYDHCFDRLFKVVNFNSIKQKEVNDACVLLATEPISLEMGVSELKFLKKIFNDETKEFRFDNDICLQALALSITTSEFVGKINNLINVKIFKWWKLYGELIELNNNYKKFKAVEVKKNKHKHLNNDESHTNGVIEINEESFNDFTNNNHAFRQTNDNAKAGILTKKASSASLPQPSFLANFVESKRQKFENKLLEGMKNVKDSLIELNKDIKYNHELIAMELNNFMNFKNDFMKIVMKRYIQREIKDLKFKNMMLKRNLDDLQSLMNK